VGEVVRAHILGYDYDSSRTCTVETAHVESFPQTYTLRDAENGRAYPDVGEALLRALSVDQVLAVLARLPSGEGIWERHAAARTRRAADADDSLTEVILTLARRMARREHDAGSSAGLHRLRELCQEQGLVAVELDHLGARVRQGEQVVAIGIGPLMVFRLAQAIRQAYGDPSPLYRNGERVRASVGASGGFGLVQDAQPTHYEIRDEATGQVVTVTEEGLRATNMDDPPAGADGTEGA
jgi:hypothetical protein